MNLVDDIQYYIDVQLAKFLSTLIRENLVDKYRGTLLMETMVEKLKNTDKPKDSK